MIPSGAEMFDDMRGLRSRKAEYLRRGIEEGQDALGWFASVNFACNKDVD